jgi:hypothetical protein
MTYDDAGDRKTRIYVNGSEASYSTQTAATGAIVDGTNIETVIGNRNGMDRPFRGTMDEVAIWSRVLTATEITDLYKRGALRIKHQVRSCDDAVCSGESWVGAAGATTGFLSELQSTVPSLPSVSLTSVVGDNRYFQYRTFVETDDATLSPELRSTVIGPSHYQGPSGSIVNSQGMAFSQLASFTTSGESGSVKYQVSRDGSTFYFHNGTAWVQAADSAAQANTSSEIQSNISSFATQVGSGTFYFRAYLINSNGTTQSQLDNVSVTGFR